MDTQEYRLDNPEENPMGSFSGTRSRQFSLFLGLDTIDLDLIARSEDEDPNERKIDPEINSFLNLQDVNEHYEHLSILADGSLAQVSEAHDKLFNRTVALKSLHETHLDSEELRKEFLAEAKIMAQLDHPSVIPVYNMCTDTAGGLHLVMKKISGKTLRSYLNKLCSLYELIPKNHLAYNEKRSLKRRLEIFLRICDAMIYVHHQNVIHNALKPENILLGKYNEVYLLDWTGAGKPGEKKLIRKGSGTSNYIAPEILDGKSFDHRADIFSLGLILFELVFLRRTFTGDTTVPETSKHRATGQEKPEHRFGIHTPNDLRRIVQKAIHPDPEKRYQSLRDFAEDIRNYLSDDRISASPNRPWTRLRRWCYRNKKFMIIFSGILMFLLGLSVLNNIFYETSSERIQKEHDIVLDRIFSRGSHVATELDSALASFESALLSICHETALLLSSTGKNEYVGMNLPKLYSYQAGAEAQTAPPGFAYAPTYRRKISFDTFVYKLPEHTSFEEMKDTLYRLCPIRQSLLRTITGTIPGEYFTANRKDELKDLAFYQKKPIMTYVYISLKNGLHLSFPYNDNVQATYDPRNRSWYIAAAQVQNPQNPVWGQPYLENGSNKELLITCSAPILSHSGELLGCAGADISLSRLLRKRSPDENAGLHVKGRYLLDKDGLIMVDTQSGRQTTSPRYFHDLPLFRRMVARNGGILRQKENGRDYLYFVQPLKTMGWYYVEQIDFQDLMQYYRRIKEKRNSA